MAKSTQRVVMDDDDIAEAVMLWAKKNGTTIEPADVHVGVRTERADNKITAHADVYYTIET